MPKLIGNLRNGQARSDKLATPLRAVNQGAGNSALTELAWWCSLKLGNFTKALNEAHHAGLVRSPEFKPLSSGVPERPDGDRNAATTPAGETRDAVLPRQVRLVRHDEHRPFPCREVAPPLGSWMAQPENPPLAERDRHDRHTDDHARRAVVMRPDVVPELPVIPVQEQAVELVVNDVPAPGEDRLGSPRAGAAPGWSARCSDNRPRRPAASAGSPRPGRGS